MFRYGSGGNHDLGSGPRSARRSPRGGPPAAGNCCSKASTRSQPARRAAPPSLAAASQDVRRVRRAVPRRPLRRWTNRKHAREWKASLTTHVLPEIGALPVAEIDTAAIIRALEPAWRNIPETASRLRTRIEQTLDWARVRGYRRRARIRRAGEAISIISCPPARSSRGVKHHAALPYRDMPALYPSCGSATRSRRARFEFVLLTAARASEAAAPTGTRSIARSRRVDLDRTAPRMKGRREHRVPLSKAARAVLEKTPPDRPSWPYLPQCGGARKDGYVTVIALWRLTRQQTDGAATTHGLRSSFRDWAGEQTNFPREVAEMALAHSVGSDTEQAYRRGDLLRKRRLLMEAWAKYCASAPAASDGREVVPIGGALHG